MSRTQNIFMIAYTQSLCAQCDLDLQTSDIVLVCNTLTFHDTCLCHIKSHHAGKVCRPDKKMFHGILTDQMFEALQKLRRGFGLSKTSLSLPVIYY